MRIRHLPAGFVVPAQPIKASKPPSGPDWVHEIKHDGYRLIVRRDGSTVRLYTRNAYDWTVGLPAIAVAAARIAKHAAMMAGRYTHAKQFNRYQRQLRLLRTRLGRLIRDICRKIAGNADLEAAFIWPL